MIKVNSVIKLNMPRIRELTKAQIAALEETAEAVHTEVEQAQVMPFDTGNLQNESTFVDCSESSSGKVVIVSSTPYARKLYFHPEYHFNTNENPNAGGEWFNDWADPPDGNGRRSEEIRDIYEKIYRRIAGL